MKKRLSISILIFVLGFPVVAHAQETLADLQQIRNRYFEPEGELNYSVRMYFYDVANLNLIEDSSNGNFRIAKGKTYAEYEGMISITNENHILVVDKENKNILLSKNKKVVPGNPSLSFLDSIFSANKVNVVSCIPAVAQNKKIRFLVPDGEIDSTDIEFNPKTDLIHSVVIYYSQAIDEDEKVKPVAKLLYYNQKVLQTYNPNHFEIGKYVRIKNTNATLSEEYKSYKLINNLIF